MQNLDEGKATKTHCPCDDCGSTDALAIYDDGHSYCFSCGSHTPQEKVKKEYQHSYKVVKPPFKSVKHTFLNGDATALPARGLSLDTCVKFGYISAEYNGEKVQVATYRKGGEIVGQKIRTKKKDFRWIGSKEPGLYGQHLWKAGGKKIVITEGEIDCLTVSQLQQHKWPVVSLPHGCASAKKAIKAELEYLESFEEVVLMFDMDEPGQKAAHECLGLLSPGKAKIASLPLKDPNEMLQAGKGNDVINAIWQAREYLPSGIVDASSMWEDLNEPIKAGLSYPWEKLTELTYGIRTGELITLGAGTGLGKTTCLKQIAHHLLTVHKEKVGLLFLEESNKMTLTSLMSIELKKALHVPGVFEDESVKKATFERLFSDSNLYLYNHFGSTNFDDIKLKIRFLVVSCGVKYIFLDHVTALTSGGKQTDERKEIDRIMTEIASSVHELDYTLFMISHLNTPETGAHEEGGRVTIRQFRGSRSIGQWSSFVFALERNQQAEDVDIRHTSTFRILKDRFSGESTGATFELKFDSNTQQLHEVSNKTLFRQEPYESENDFDDF